MILALLLAQAVTGDLPAIDTDAHCQSRAATVRVEDCVAREDTALARLQTSWPDFSDAAQDNCASRLEEDDITSWSGLEACLVIASLNAPRRAPPGTIALQSASPESQTHAD
ncbi:hypothetical protein [Hyphobacterium marinum]|uniref:Secreted protein n=1 Tax=Hyphobacterium marinum TaxID=3116574 RepID=A0ABU7M100_9PROT|nr:hypothetical protein [Hyphobacterium sp. Y6023]MEE2567499.1 hypothetical protein [Hyphobacterium sp. Y6023]